MPVPTGVTIEERSNSRSGEYRVSNTIEYWVRGADDQGEVQEAVLATAPLTFNGLVYDTFAYSSVDDDESLFYVQVKYRPPRDLRSPPEPGTARYFWAVAGESTKITHPISVISRNRPDAGTAVQYKGIGDDGEELQGTEIVIPKFTFGYDFTIPGVDVDSGFIATVASLVGKVNDDTWKGFAAGSVLFTGASGSYEIGEDSTITFEFAYSANSSQFVIGGYTIGDGSAVVKKGWEYADVHSTKKQEQGVLKLEISQVDILKVYDLGDFDALGIP